MSVNTYTIPVPFAAELNIHKSFPLAGKGVTVTRAVANALRELDLTIDDVDVEVREYPREGFLGFGFREAEVLVFKKPVFHDKTIGTVVNGWLHKSADVEIKRGRDSVYVQEFTKGTGVVHVVNESPYESVGEIAYTAFADVEDDLKMFLSDFGMAVKITAGTAVQQTI